MSIAALSDLAKALPTNIDRTRNGNPIGNLLKNGASSTSQSVDDIASFTQAVSLQSEANALRSASASIVQAGSLLEVADQGLGQLQQGLSTLGAIITQSQRGNLTDQDRASLQQKANAVLRSLKDIVDQVKFNDAKLLDGSLSLASDQGAKLALGGSNADKLNLRIGDYSLDKLFDGKGIDLTSLKSSNEAASLLPGANAKLASGRTDLGALQQRFGIASAALQSAYQNQEAARSTLDLSDLLGGGGSNNGLLSAIQAQSGVAMLAQSNKLQSSVLDLLNG